MKSVAPRIFACVLLFAVVSNCMTVLTLTNYKDRYQPVLYSGVRTSLGYDPHAHNPVAGLVQTLMFIDLPFSAVLDTLILPATLPLAAFAQSKDLAFERQGNPYVRLVLPPVMDLLLLQGNYSLEDGQNPFPPASRDAQQSDNSTYKLIHLPVKNLEAGVPGCYLHCATREEASGLFSLGRSRDISWRTFGLIRVKGVYKRERPYRNETFQYCLPDGGTRGDDNVQSMAINRMCNDAFPACKGDCIARNHFGTLYYANPDAGKVLPEQP